MTIRAQPLLKPSDFYSFCRPPGLYSGGFFAMLEMEYCIREDEGSETEDERENGSTYASEDKPAAGTAEPTLREKEVTV